VCVSLCVCLMCLSQVSISSVLIPWSSSRCAVQCWGLSFGGVWRSSYLQQLLHRHGCVQYRCVACINGCNMVQGMHLTCTAVVLLLMVVCLCACATDDWSQA
jgi:hypothetical protein